MVEKMEVDTISLESKLSGTLGERHKILNNLIKVGTQQPSSDIVPDVSSKERLDLIYLAKVANQTKNAAVICELLKSQDGMVVNIALKAKWLFTGTTHPDFVNIDYFSKQIFPHASYHSICRIVSNLSAFLQVETVAEDFYKYIDEWYGRKMALKLLPKCGVDFIRFKIIGVLYTLPCVQLLQIYTKDKGLALEYLDKYLIKEHADKLPFNYNWKHDYKKIVEQLAEDDYEIFLNFMEKHRERFSLRIGQKTTAKMMKTHKQRIMDNIDRLSCLHYKTVIHSLKGEELEKYLLTCLSDKKEEFKHFKRQPFDTFKPLYKLELLKKIYSMKYNGASLLDEEYFIQLRMVDYMSTEERIKWAKEKIEQIKLNKDETKEEVYLVYLSTQEAIPLLQVLCKATNDSNRRTSLLQNMVTCCAKNDDKISLLGVIKYVATRHRNDVASLRSSFLGDVSNNFTLHKLSAEHWKLLLEMIDFLIVENTNTMYYNYYWSNPILDLTNEYLKYCSVNNLDLETCVDRMIMYKEKNIVQRLTDFKCDQRVLNALVNKYEQIILELNNSDLRDDVDANFKNVFEILSLISKLKDEVSVTQYPWLLDFIKVNYIKWSDSDKTSIFWEMRKDKKARDIFVEEIYKYNLNERLIPIYMKHNLDVIKNQLEHFIDKTVSPFKKKSRLSRIYGKINTYLMNPLGDNISNILKERASNEDTEDVEEMRKIGINMVFLCYLSTPNECKALMEKHGPTDFKVNLGNDTKKYIFGEVLGRYMKTINPPIEYSTLMCYTGGDYFKNVLGSLLALAHKKPTMETKQFIHELSQKPISVKKHFLRLSKSLCRREELLPLYKTAWETEKNASMRGIIFTLTHSMMVAQEDIDKYNEIWEVVKSFMNSFTEVDRNLFPYLTKPQSMMRHHVTEYCDVCWNILKRISNTKIGVGEFISKLLRSFSDCGNLLSEHLCEDIVLEYLKSITDPNVEQKPDDLLIFLVNYLVKAKSFEAQSSRSVMAFEILKKFITENWNMKEDRRDDYEHRQFIKKFVNLVCRQSIKARLELCPILLLKSLSEMLTSVLPLGTVLDVIIQINLTIRYKELLLNPKFLEYSQKDTESQLSKDFIHVYGEEIGKYFNELCAEYGAEIERSFAKAFGDFRSTLLSYNDSVVSELLIIEGLIKKFTNRQCLLLAVDLLPSIPYHGEPRTFFFKVMDDIIAKGDTTVNIILSNKVPLNSKVFMK